MNTIDQAIKVLTEDVVGMRVLVVGDIMLDRYIWGRAERISPEAPIPVLSVTRRSQMPGGAANVAMNLVGLGAQVILAGFCGSDDDGNELRILLERAGIDCSRIISSALPTTSKTRVIGHNQQVVRFDVEQVLHSAAEHRLLWEQVATAADNVHAILLSDYAKGTLDISICQGLIQVGRTRGIPVLVDPKERNFSKYARATTICPNLSELAVATGLHDASVDNLLNAAQPLVEQNSIDYLTVTMGERGICIVRTDSIFHAPARTVDVFDISGAGDTAIATLAVCLASGLTPEVGVELANSAAGIAISRVGTSVISRHELIAAVTTPLRRIITDKILELDTLLNYVATWRSEGRTIVFTNGCFDLLHVGHIELLQRCRSFGDRLIVGVNSDSSIQRLKGSKRPIIEAQDRARMLAALVYTDAVAIFDEDTPISLIHGIRPDVLVKGGDYQEATVVGHPDVVGWGGRVEIVPILNGKSTTRIIQTIVERDARSVTL
jgi:D-beta-D-heptose 7-phosphate kinase / D-beta-D-heptose 1-phosphate adenosyltransferase